ncbi:MAG TPA: PIN domain-containing protein [Candidatus Acidoferrales bacterium]|nr:PIN domain-containing protein [Candidatus Acidoferrales bacterium]
MLLGVLDPEDSHHSAATHALRQARDAGHEVILPASALAEVLVGASRLGARAVRKTEAFVDAVVDRVEAIDRAAARTAAGYRARQSSLRLPDAFVLAVGSILKADAVLTADSRWAKVDRRVDVIAAE